ncbi:Mitochondrial inner membrane protease atp23 [Tulasnella sp. 331]|nr:Mitochondrial inner membrane protease atp23 [Tulasnella sp. 331]
MSNEASSSKPSTAPVVAAPSKLEQPTPSSSTNARDERAFERWRKSAAWLTGIGLSPEEQAQRQSQRDLQKEEAQWIRCEKWKEELLKTSPAVTFMMKHLRASGANVTGDHIHCQPCQLTRAGGFSPESGILLCQDGFWSKSHMEDTMVHELVHMYDHTKFKVDWKDLRHHACSEIRAANLSGDCKWSREIRRGFYTFSKQHQDCVRRRAVLSVMSHPDCGDQAKAEKAVNEVWESCLKDTRPFDEIY